MSTAHRIEILHVALFSSPLVNIFVCTVWVKIQLLKKMLTLLDLGSFLKNPKIVGKSSACPMGVFSMPPNPLKCHMQQKTTKFKFLIITLKFPQSSALQMCKISILWAVGSSLVMLPQSPRVAYDRSAKHHSKAQLELKQSRALELEQSSGLHSKWILMDFNGF